MRRSFISLVLARPRADRRIMWTDKRDIYKINASITLTLFVVGLHGCSALNRKSSHSKEFKVSDHRPPLSDFNNLPDYKITNDQFVSERSVRDNTNIRTQREIKLDSLWDERKNDRKNNWQQIRYPLDEKSLEASRKDYWNNKIRYMRSANLKTALPGPKKLEDFNMNLTKKYNKKYAGEETENRIYKKISVMKDSTKQNVLNGNYQTRRVARHLQNIERKEKYSKDKNHFKRKVNCLRKSAPISKSSVPEHHMHLERLRRQANLAKTHHDQRRNSTEYYEQRKKVMEKFYARRRELAMKYGKGEQTNLSARGITPRNDRFQLSLSPHSTTTLAPTTRKTGFDNNFKLWVRFNNDSFTKVNPDDAHSVNWPKKNFTVNLNAPVPPTNGSHVSNYLTSRNCTNALLSGRLPFGTRSKVSDRDTRGRGDIDQCDNNTSSEVVDIVRDNNTEVWGECAGSLVYQHNLNVGLGGNVSSQIETSFEVLIQGSICITCVVTRPYNNSRATVKLEAGGKGFDYVKLHLIGLDNGSFSYIIQIYGIKKRGDMC